MYRKLIETEGEEINQIQVNSIKQILSKLKKIVDYEPKIIHSRLKRIKKQ